MQVQRKRWSDLAEEGDSGGEETEAIIEVWKAINTEEDVVGLSVKPAAQMVVVYVMRPPWAKDPFPPWVFLPFHRLAAIHESPLFCFL